MNKFTSIYSWEFGIGSVEFELNLVEGSGFLFSFIDFKLDCTKFKATYWIFENLYYKVLSYTFETYLNVTKKKRMHKCFSSSKFIINSNNNEKCFLTHFSSKHCLLKIFFIFEYYSIK